MMTIIDPTKPIDREYLPVVNLLAYEMFSLVKAKSFLKLMNLGYHGDERTIGK